MDHLQEVLDLSIVFTKPPSNSSPEILAQVVFQCETLGLSHTGEVFADPLTQREREDLLWYLEKYWEWPYLEFAERGKRVEALLDEVGRRLYQALFGSREVLNIVQVWQQRVGVQHRISIVSEIARVLRLPWELLADQDGFLLLRTDHPFSIVRRFPKDNKATLTTPFHLPLRVLLVTARPEDAAFVDSQSISRELVDELQTHSDAGTIELEFLRPPTFRALRDRLLNTELPSIHVLHFDGHGEFDSKAQQGVLLFETNAGKQSRVTASAVAKVLSNSGIWLAILTACKSATSAEDDAFSSVSTQLIDNGIGAVIAMSSNILETSAALYVEAFYHALVAGLPVSIAQEQARQALQKDPRRHLFHRHHDEEAAPVKLQDWWVPHFYQQHSALFQLTPPNSLSVQSPQKSPVLQLRKGMPPEPRYGFNGRAHELQQIERHLLQRKLIVLHGLAGVGKTALACEAANWLRRTQMYDGTCFVSFEQRGDVVWLLGELGRYLEIYDESYNPGDTIVALAHLKPVLEKRRILVIADSFETWLAREGVPQDPIKLSALLSMLLVLREIGADIILTTRDISFSNGDDLPSLREESTAPIHVQGLQPKDAYALASSLLIALHVDRTHTPYVELHSLLVQLDYNPLAIQLVLPALRQYGLETIRHEFATLLPEFQDDSESGRNSLENWLDSGNRRFSDALHVVSSHLDILDSVASEEKQRMLETIREELVDLLPFELLELQGGSEYGHNRSLLASLDYSLRHLSDAERALLSRLAFFEGGASEDVLLTITMISSDEWARLRQTLELRGLITAEHIAGFPAPFLHFHPMLAPYLRSQSGIRDATLDMILRELYIRRYVSLANDLYYEDHLRPQPTVRALVQKELPNLQKTLQMLLEAGELEVASALSGVIIWFLTVLRMIGVRDEIQQHIDEVVATQSSHKQGELTMVEYLHEIGLSEDERRQGNIRAACDRLTSLLARMEVLPEDNPLGRGSDSYSATLVHLSYSLTDLGQPALAEEHLRKALLAIEELIRRNPEGNTYLLMRAEVLGEIARVLTDQGKYPRARETYEQALALRKQLGGLTTQAEVMLELDMLELAQDDDTEEESRYIVAVQHAQSLNEPENDPENEARLWHRLGRAAKKRRDWTEAERFYRKSVEISERFDDVAGVAANCNELANIAKQSGRFKEAEGWYKQGLELLKRTNSGSPGQATMMENMADLLVLEVRADYTTITQLDEAKRYAEQALAIHETLATSSGRWTVLDTLATIAEMEGQTEVAQTYRRRARETFADFEGNRYHSDRKAGLFIAAIAVAARGNTEIQERVEAKLPEWEEQGWSIALATRRIWAGERDWHALVEDLDNEDALLILRVLETIVSPHDIHEKSLEISKLQGDQESQAAHLAQLGLLALQRHDYAEAQVRYTGALQVFQEMAEPVSEARLWHQLGLVAEEQRSWTEAEHCYRESLAIKERLGDAAGAAETCNKLAFAVKESGRLTEAEEWCKRTLVLDKQAHPGSPKASYLYNLATLQVNQVREEPASIARLAEAKHHAKQALAIDEMVATSAKIWKGFDLLATIAEMEGQTEVAQTYRRRARETFAAFKDNRTHNEHQHGPLIALIAVSAQSNTKAQKVVKVLLPLLEAKSVKIASVMRRIWAGERDWYMLVEDLDNEDALLTLRVLETIMSPEGTALPKKDVLFASLPAPIREVIQQGNMTALPQVANVLAPEEWQRALTTVQVLVALEALEKLSEDGE